MAELFAGGSQVGQCLGPLGVTAVQCAQATGVFPGAGIGLPIFVVMVALSTLTLVPSLRSRWPQSVLAGVVGAAAGLVAYLALWPTTISGPISTGEWITIPRPADLNVFAATVLAATLVAFLLADRNLRAIMRGSTA